MNKPYNLYCIWFLLADLGVVDDDWVDPTGEYTYRGLAVDWYDLEPRGIAWLYDNAARKHP